MTATVAQAGAISRFTFSGSAGQKVYLDASASTFRDECGLITIVDGTGKILASGCVINGKGGIDGVTLPSSGSYAVVVDPGSGHTGPSTLRLHT